MTIKLTLICDQQHGFSDQPKEIKRQSRKYKIPINKIDKVKTKYKRKQKYKANYENL